MGMQTLRSRCGLWLAAAALSVSASYAQAAAVSFTGAFTQDDNVFLIPFSLDSAQTVTLRTYGYAGGTNAAGAAIAAGGFDPILTLFSGGTLTALSDDGIGVATDPTTGRAADSLISVPLAAGSYVLALTQYDNFPNGNLGDGFASAFGPGNFTPLVAADAGNVCPATQFCDFSGVARTANYAVDLVNVSAVPEPASLALFALGFAGCVAVRRRLQG